MQMAIAENRLIITFDRDYGELIYKHHYKPTAGVIYLRFKNSAPDYPGNYLLHIFESKDYEFSSKFTVIDKNSIRQRTY